MRALLISVLLLLPVTAYADSSSARIAALWQRIGNVEALAGVDQIIIEGDADSPMLRGTLERRHWMDPPAMYQSKPFWASIEKQCSFDIPGCFKVKSIWSRSELLYSE